MDGDEGVQAFDALGSGGGGDQGKAVAEGLDDLALDAGAEAEGDDGDAVGGVEGGEGFVGKPAGDFDVGACEFLDGGAGVRAGEGDADRADLLFESGDDLLHEEYGGVDIGGVGEAGDEEDGAGFVGGGCARGGDVEGVGDDGAGEGAGGDGSDGFGFFLGEIDSDVEVSPDAALQLFHPGGVDEEFGFLLDIGLAAEAGEVEVVAVEAEDGAGAAAHELVHDVGGDVGAADHEVVEVGTVGVEPEEEVAGPAAVEDFDPEVFERGCVGGAV